MPITPTYPGVYIEELPSGVRTITGVATSITAFIGRARRGPVNEPVTVNSYGEFERIFGGLWIDSAMSYAVRDFYLNGGSQAIIVRLFNPYFPEKEDQEKALNAAQEVAKAAESKANEFTDETAKKDTGNKNIVVDAARNKAAEFTEQPQKTAADIVVKAADLESKKNEATTDAIKDAVKAAVGKAAPSTKARLVVGNTNQITLSAANEGAWGNKLRSRVDYDTGIADTNLFNISIKDVSTGQVEVFRNVSIQQGHPRQVDKVLEQQSQLVRVYGSLPSSRPEVKGDDKGIVPPGKDAFSEEFSSGVTPNDSATDGIALSENDCKGSEANKQGIYALEKADLFNLLCIPPYTTDGNIDSSLIGVAATYCEKRRAMLIVDPQSSWNDKNKAKAGISNVGTNSKNAAIFFPRLIQPDPLRENQMREFAPCGAIAGVFARTDAQRGVWKAPAGLDAVLTGVPQLTVSLTDAENGELNPLGINCLRSKPAAGRVIWGARTLQGDDRLASEWKYIPVRRLALYIEESLYRGTQWVVFEPNDEPLWSQIRLNLGAFMHNLFRQGAFQGKTPKEAYFVKCDKETTTQNDINQGIVNIVVGFAPLKPAEFVIIKIQQMAGQIEV